MTQYFIKRNDKVNGPFTSGQITSGIKSKKLKATDIVATSEAGPWEPLSDIYQKNEAVQTRSTVTPRETTDIQPAVQSHPVDELLVNLNNLPAAESGGSMQGSLSVAERMEAKRRRKEVERKGKEAQEGRRDFIVKLSVGIGMLVVVVVLIRLVYKKSSEVAVEYLIPSAQQNAPNSWIPEHLSRPVRSGTTPSDKAPPQPTLSSIGDLSGQYEIGDTALARLTAANLSVSKLVNSSKPGFLTAEEDVKFLEEFSKHGSIKADFKIKPIPSGDEGKSMMCTIVKIYETTPDLKEIYNSDIRKLFKSDIIGGWVVIVLTHDQLKTTSIAKQALKAELKLKRFSDLKAPL